MVGEYVRLFGIDTKAKRRVLETIIQNPMVRFQELQQELSPSSAADSSSSSSPSHSKRLSSGCRATSPVTAQGCQISTEYADERRFKTSSWQSGGAIQANRESEVITALEATLRTQSVVRTPDWY